MHSENETETSHGAYIRGYDDCEVDTKSFRLLGCDRGSQSIIHFKISFLSIEMIFIAYAYSVPSWPT